MPYIAKMLHQLSLLGDRPRNSCVLDRVLCMFRSFPENDNPMSSLLTGHAVPSTINISLKHAEQ
jgi:hypothetical protein